MCGCPVFVGLITPTTILETCGDSLAALTAGIAASMTVVWLRVSLAPFRRPFGVLWATETTRQFHFTALGTPVRARNRRHKPDAFWGARCRCARRADGDGPEPRSLETVQVAT